MLQDALPKLTKDGLKPKDIVECLAPEIQTSCLKLALPDLKTEEQLLKLDEQAVHSCLEIGPSGALLLACLHFFVTGHKALQSRHNVL